MATKIKSKMALLLEEQSQIEFVKTKIAAAEKQAAEDKIAFDFMNLLKVAWERRGAGVYSNTENSITWSLPVDASIDKEVVFDLGQRQIRISKTTMKLKLPHYSYYGNQTDIVYELERILKEAKELLAGFDTVKVTVPVPISEEACDIMISWVKNKAKAEIVDVDSRIALLKEQHRSFVEKAESLPHPMDALALVANDHKKSNRKKAVLNA